MPDGTQIAFRSNRDGDSDVYVMNANGSNLRQLTNSPEFDGSPSWSPDGTPIAFDTKRDGNFEIYVMNAGGSDQRNVTNNPDADEQFPDWGQLHSAQGRCNDSVNAVTVDNKTLSLAIFTGPAPFPLVLSLSGELFEGNPGEDPPRRGCCGRCRFRAREPSGVRKEVAWGDH